jgi:PAS domain S-box-containing protein
MLNPTQTHAQNHPTPLRILFLEDDPQDRELAARAIAAEGLLPEFVYAVTQADFEGALARQAFDLIMSDFTLPAYTGADALAVAKKVQPDTPFVFFSGTIGEERAVESLKSGATDYVLKDRPETLIPAIRRALREASLRRDRKLAEDALRASEARYRSLFENMVEGFAYCRIFFAAGQAQDFLYLEVNGAFEKLTGLKNVVGRKMSEVVPGLLESQPELLRVFGRVAMTGHPERIEIEIKALAGWYSIAAYSMEPGSFMIVFDNITERKALEADLRQAQKMEAIGQLAGGVAHDFNNMLAVMRGNAELLLLEVNPHNARASEGLKQITAAAERAANLTRQLLAFSRKQVMQSRPVLLNEIVADLTKMLKRIIGENIDLQCHYGASLPYVRADTGMIEQVLINLVVNARDAMPSGGQLHISTELATFNAVSARANPEARPGQFVRLIVRDTGEGIAPANLPRIFDPFFTTKDPGKGTGLGLATVYGIVKQHEGWVEVVSRPGTGAAFHIYLPASRLSAAKAAAPSAEPPLRGGSETILLVEDDAAVRLVTRRVLESLGYKVWEATQAREAMEIWGVHAGEIDLLLSDIVMPDGTSGRELAEQLRIQSADLKIILMSGYSPETAGRETEFFRRSEIRFLQKPCSSNVLLDAVRNCLDED